jgi:hypothetical protein
MTGRDHRQLTRRQVPAQAAESGGAFEAADLRQVELSWGLARRTVCVDDDGDPAVPERCQVGPDKGARLLVVDGHPGGGRVGIALRRHESDPAHLGQHGGGMAFGYAESGERVNVGLPNGGHVGFGPRHRDRQQHDARAVALDHLA